jgi:hypothetical protein
VTLSNVNKYAWAVKKASAGLRFRPSRKARIVRLASGSPPNKLVTAPGAMLKKRDVEDIETYFSPDAADNDGNIKNPHRGEITIDYTIQRSDGNVSLTLRNRPGDGNFANVFLVIEETPRPIPGPWPAIRTAVDISTVGLEHHLDQDYFDHIEDCQARLAEILEYLNHYVNVPPPGPRIPRWDPYRFRNIERYLAIVNRMQPQLVPRQLMTRAALRRIATLELSGAEQPPHTTRTSGNGRRI